MPLVTRFFVKTSLLFFVLSLLCGLLLTLRPLVPLPPLVLGLTPVYFHLFMVGWVTQIIIGVAYWMFPKYTKEEPRGSELLAWITYVTLNAGLLLRTVAEPVHGVHTQPIWGWLVAAAALLQWLGGVAFIANTWPRVKER